MPQHRRKEKLPQRLLDRIKASDYSEFFGHGLLLNGAHANFLRPKINGKKVPRGSSIEVQYSLKDHVVTRTEFLQGLPSIPIHMSHFDSETGQRFSTVLDCY